MFSIQMQHTSIKITNSMIFCCLLMALASTDIKGWQTAVLKKGEGEWARLVYPNPLTQPTECNRLNSSYVCDPDGVLTSADADKLDLLANEIHKITPCLCSNCSRNAISGVSLGIFLRNNLTDYERSIKDFTTDEMTRYIRRQWHLGSCDDDIVIIVIIEEKKSHFDMGSPVLQMMPPKVAEKIFNDCLVHFETGYSSQGLRSIVNSLYDILKSSQRKKPNKKYPKLTMGVIIGLSMGTAFIFIVVIALIICRKKCQNKMARTKNNTVTWEKAKNHHIIEYGICEMHDAELSSNRSGSDEEESSPENEENEHEKYSMKKT